MPQNVFSSNSKFFGFFTIKPMLFGSFFGSSIFYDTGKHPAMEELAKDFHGPAEMALGAFAHPTLYLAIAGVLLSAQADQQREADDLAAARRRYARNVANLNAMRQTAALVDEYADVMRRRREIAEIVRTVVANRA